MGIKRRIAQGIATGAAGVLAASSLVFAGTASAAESEPAVFSCTYTTWALDYQPVVELAQSGAAVTVSMGDFPAIAGVPAFVTVSKVVGKVAATVDGKTVTLAGSQVVDPATPMAEGFKVPVLSGSLPAGLPATTLAVTDLDITVTALGGDHAISCDVVTAPVFDVAATPVVKVSSQTTAKVAVTKKRVPTVSVTVKGGAGSATGKVALAVTQGKKTLQKKTVTLRKGAATTKLKKLKKGKYAVVVKYSGDQAYQSSQKKVAFKVK